MSESSAKAQRPLTIFLVVFLGVNGLALLLAFVDRSWFAFGIGMVVAPAANALIALLSFAGFGARGMAWKYRLMALVGPLLAAGVDYFVIFSMGLHGC